MRGFSRILGWREKKNKKNLFISKNARISSNFGVKPQKNRVFYYKICEKAVLALEFWGDNQYLGSRRPKLHSSGTKPVTFFDAQSSLGGHNSRLGRHKQWFGGHGPVMLPVASCLLQVYCNLSNCNYRIFVKEILLEIGFIEEMRTIWGNKEVPQTFFHNFLYLRKYNLICLTPYPC